MVMSARGFGYRQGFSERYQFGRVEGVFSLEQ